MNRKILLSIIIGIVIIVLGILSWYFFLRPSNTPATIQTGTGLPFGQGTGSVSPNPSQGTPSGSNDVGLNTAGQPTQTLFQISNTPVAGAVLLGKGASTTIRYVDRATGHIYDVNPTTMEKKQIINNTIPKIQEAYFKNDGSAVIYRSIKDGSDIIQNTLLVLTPPKSTSTDALYTVATASLPSNLGDMAVGPTNNIAYVLNDSGSVVTSGFDGSKSSSLFSSAFTNWLVSWPSSNIVTLTTKASSDVPGYLYFINPSNSSMKKVLGNINGLTTLTNLDGTKVLYSGNINGSLGLYLYDTKANTNTPMLPVTLPEKCVWSNLNKGTVYCAAPNQQNYTNLPDSWYQGQTSFTDSLWSMDTAYNIKEQISNLSQVTKQNIDATNLMLSPSENYLVFTNKNDLSLWALKLQ